jgi:hypothetical protein
METHAQDIDLIQSYLDRSLSAIEKEKLEKRLKEEPLLKTMYLEQQQLINGIRYSHLQHKLEQLRALEATLPALDLNAQKGRQFSLQRYWKPLAVAASISIIVVTFIFLNRPDDPAELYASYFEPYPNIFEPIVRGENDVVSKRSIAFQAYESGNYTQAASLFTELLQEKKEPGMLLLLGNANLMLNNTKEARNNFITLINDFEEYDLQSKWYLGLSYLKEGDLKSAQLIMREVSNSEYSYAGKAKELLKKTE